MNLQWMFDIAVPVLDRVSQTNQLLARERCNALIDRGVKHIDNEGLGDRLPELLIYFPLDSERVLTDSFDLGRLPFFVSPSSIFGRIHFFHHTPARAV